MTRCSISRGKEQGRSSLTADLLCAPFMATLQALHWEQFHPFWTLPGYFSLIVSQISTYLTFSNSCKTLALYPHFWGEKLRHEKEKSLHWLIDWLMFRIKLPSVCIWELGSHLDHLKSPWFKWLSMHLFRRNQAFIHSSIAALIRLNCESIISFSAVLYLCLASDSTGPLPTSLLTRQ